MQDEQFMRAWNSNRDRLSDDLQRGLGRIRRYATQPRAVRQPIGGSYGFLAKYEQPKPARPALPPAAQASLRGLAASVITVALWVIVMMVEAPPTSLA